MPCRYVSGNSEGRSERVGDSWSSGPEAIICAVTAFQCTLCPVFRLLAPSQTEIDTMDSAISQNILKGLIERYAFCGLNSKNAIYTSFWSTHLSGLLEPCACSTPRGQGIVFQKGKVNTDGIIFQAVKTELSVKNRNFLVNLLLNNTQGEKKPLKCFSQWKKEDTFSGFPVIVLHLKRVLNSTQAFFLLFCSGGMGVGSILRMLTRVLSGTDFPVFLVWNSKTTLPLF